MAQSAQIEVERVVAIDHHEEVAAIIEEPPPLPSRRRFRRAETVTTSARPRPRDGRYITAKDDVDWDTPAYQRRAK